MLIRQEKVEDYDIVYDLVKKAFESAEHSDGNEQDLVAALRKSTAFIPELSLVAEVDGKIVGHILFTKIQIGDFTEIAIAPLSVLPEFQNRGIGSALIKEGHRIAKKLGFRFSVVLGSDAYYQKFGYVPAENYGITAPFDVPSENFMAFEFCSDEKFSGGVVKYAEEFGI